MNYSETLIEPSTVGTTRKHSVCANIFVLCVYIGIAAFAVLGSISVYQHIRRSENAAMCSEIMSNFSITGRYDPSQNDHYGNPIDFIEIHADEYRWLIIRSPGPDGVLKTDDDCVRLSAIWDGDGDEPEENAKNLRCTIIFQTMLDH